MRQTASKPARAERGHPGGRPQGAQWRSAGPEGLLPARAVGAVRGSRPPHPQLPRSVSWVRHGPAPPAALTLCFPTAHEWVLPGWKPNAPRPPWAQPGAAAKGTRRERPPGRALLVCFRRSAVGCAILARPAGQTVRKAFREEPLSPTSHPPQRPSRRPVPGYAEQRSTCILKTQNGLSRTLTVSPGLFQLGRWGCSLTHQSAPPCGPSSLPAPAPGRAL